MTQEHTTQAVQRYLTALAGDEEADPIVRALLGRSAQRLQMLSATMLQRQYPRLMRPPSGVDQDEILGLLVERLLKALRKVKPRTVREFFALANQHIRWELNELARRLDKQPLVSSLPEEVAAQPTPPSSSDSARVQMIFDAIEQLPEEVREAFCLVRIQGLTHEEAANVIGVSAKTVQRRLNQALQQLMDQLSSLRPGSTSDHEG